MARTIAINLFANDKTDKAFKSAARGADHLSDKLDTLNKVMAGVALATAASQAVVLTKALVPAVAAISAVPAAMAGVVAATSTMTIGLNGVGDAMKAVSEGDAEKLNAAMAKLSPTARGFVKSYQEVSKAFKKNVQLPVQNELFRGLGDAFKHATMRGMSLSNGMVNLAGALNDAAKTGLRLTETNLFRGAVAETFTTTTRMTRAWTSALRPLAAALATMIKVGLPFVEQLNTWVVQGVKAASGFVASERGIAFMRSGIEKTINAFKSLGTIIKNVFVAFRNIGSASSAFVGTQTNILDLMVSLTAQFAKWTGSAEGQQKLADAFRVLNDILQALADTAPLFAGTLGAVATLIGALPEGTRDVVVQMIAWGAALNIIASRLKVVKIAQLAYRTSVILTKAALLAAKGAYIGFLLVQKSLVAVLYSTTVRMVAQRVAMVAARAVMISVRVVTLAWVTAQWLLNAALTANPIGIVIAIIAALVVGIVVAYKKSETFRKIVDATWRGIVAAAKWAWSTTLKPIFDAIKFYITRILIPGYKLLWSVVKSVFGSIGSYFKFQWNIWKGIFNAARSAVGAVGNAFKSAASLIKRVWGGLTSIIQRPVDAFIRAFNRISGIASSIRGLASSLPGFAMGGVIPGCATGGVLPGYKPGHDTMLAMLSPGEDILRPEAVKALGAGWIDRMNTAARTGGVGGARDALSMATTAPAGGMSLMSRGQASTAVPASGMAVSQVNVILQFESHSMNAFDKFLIDSLRRGIKGKGGNVQVVLGK